MQSKERHDFIDNLINDLLRDLPDVTHKNMFGGVGLYLNGVIFGFTNQDDHLLFKVNNSNRADYDAYDAEQFIYTGHKNRKPTAMPYYQVPDEIIESPE